MKLMLGWEKGKMSFFCDPHWFSKERQVNKGDNSDLFRLAKIEINLNLMDDNEDRTIIKCLFSLGKG